MAQQRRVQQRHVREPATPCATCERPDRARLRRLGTGAGHLFLARLAHSQHRRLGIAGLAIRPRVAAPTRHDGPAAARGLRCCEPSPCGRRASSARNWTESSWPIDTSSDAQDRGRRGGDAPIHCRSVDRVRRPTSVASSRRYRELAGRRTNRVIIDPGHTVPELGGHPCRVERKLFMRSGRGLARFQLRP